MAFKTSILKTALRNFDVNVNKIKKATGISDIDTIYEKFMSKDDLQRTLDSQQL